MAKAPGHPRIATDANLRPAPGIRSLRLAVGQLGAIAALLVVIESALVVAGPAEPAWVVVMFPVVGALYVGAGVVAWIRRPNNRFGALLVFAGAAVFVAGLANTEMALLIAIGQVFATAILAVIVHMLLAFPSGRLRDRRSRVLAIAAYVVAIAMQVPLYVFAPGAPPYDVLQLAARPDLVHAGEVAQRTAGVVVMLATAAVLAQRLSAASTSQRRVLAPLYVYGATAVLLIPLSVIVLAPLLDLSGITVAVFQLVVVGLVPVAFLAALFRGGFARTAGIEELGAWLGTDDTSRPGIRDALRTTLGDPSVDLAFWMSDGGCYVDGHGLPVELPAPDSGRADVEVAVGGRRIGAIVYDSRLIADQGPVRAAGRVVAIALDREQLTARLRASREALLQSRLRIVEAADGERRRIAQDLHDGLQARLVLLAVEAARVDAETVRAGIIAAIDDLRTLVHGVMPPLLIEQGFYAAAEDLVDRLPIPARLSVVPEVPARLPPALERTAYLVVAEAVVNAVKHAQAREIDVLLERVNGHLRIEVADDGVGGASPLGGSGLRGLVDRLDAFGGRLTIDSAVGRGTRLVAEVPCGS